MRSMPSTPPAAIPPTIGFKNGFCVLDLGSCNYGGGPQKYTCSNMGITASC